MSKLNKKFKENEYFQEVYLGKDDSIFTSMPVTENGNERDTEIFVSKNGKENFKLITDNEIVIVDGNLFINQLLVTSTERSTYAWVPSLNLFNVTWISAMKIEKYMNNDLTYQAIGFDSETNLPIFMHVYLEDGKVNMFKFELFRGILPSYTTKSNIDILINSIKNVNVESLTSQCDDGITLFKKFSSNNLVLNITRRLISHLGSEGVVLQARTFRTGMDNFFKEISTLFDIGSNFKFSIKEKLGYRLNYVIGGIEFNPYVSAYMLNSEGGEGSTINVYPAYNELNFEHIDGLIKSLAVELHKWEKERYDVFKLTEDGNSILMAEDGTTINYYMFELDNESKGFSLHYIDEYNRPIFKIDDKICIINVATKVQDEDSKPLDMISCNARFTNEEVDTDISISIKQVKIVPKENSYKSVNIKVVGEPLVEVGIHAKLAEVEEHIYEIFKITNNITVDNFKEKLENILR